MLDCETTGNLGYIFQNFNSDAFIRAEIYPVMRSKIAAES